MEVVEVFFGWKELWPLGCLELHRFLHRALDQRVLWNGQGKQSIDAERCDNLDGKADAVPARCSFFLSSAHKKM